MGSALRALAHPTTTFKNCLYVQKLFQILVRLERPGITSPDAKLKDDLIDEIHQFSRIMEENEAHAIGTLEPGREKPWLRS